MNHEVSLCPWFAPRCCISSIPITIHIHIHTQIQTRSRMGMRKGRGGFARGCMRVCQL